MFNVKDKRGTVTRVVSDQTVEIDGVLHHVKDLHHRKVRGPKVETITTDGEDE